MSEIDYGPGGYGDLGGSISFDTSTGAVSGNIAASAATANAPVPCSGFSCGGQSSLPLIILVVALAVIILR